MPSACSPTLTRGLLSEFESVRTPGIYPLQRVAGDPSELCLEFLDLARLGSQLLVGGTLPNTR